MHLSPEDVQDIVHLMDSLSQDEFELRTSQLHLTVRRAGREGWTQESRVLSAPNVVATEPGGAGPVEAVPVKGGPVEAGSVKAGPVEAGSAGAESDGAGLGAADLGGAHTDGADNATVDPVRPGLTAIRAPLPGTFYRAPKPGADPYVEIGSRVAEDTVVGLLETMKLFNSVHANVRGVVVEFLINDAEPAGQDAVLILVRPDGPRPQHTREG